LKHAINIGNVLIKIYVSLDPTLVARFTLSSHHASTRQSSIPAGFHEVPWLPLEVSINIFYVSIQVDRGIIVAAIAPPTT
jgi:hypothetical protein